MKRSRGEEQSNLGTMDQLQSTEAVPSISDMESKKLRMEKDDLENPPVGLGYVGEVSGSDIDESSLNLRKKSEDQHGQNVNLDDQDQDSSVQV